MWENGLPAKVLGSPVPVTPLDTARAGPAKAGGSSQMFTARFIFAAVILQEMAQMWLASSGPVLRSSGE